MLRRIGTVVFSIVMLLGVFAVGGIPDVQAKSACSCACVDLGVPDTASVPEIAFWAIPGNAQMLLWWGTLSADVAEVRLMHNASRLPSGPTDGTLLFIGLGDSFLQNGVANTERQYYGLYAYDADGNLISAATVSAVPQENLSLDDEAPGEAFNPQNPNPGAQTSTPVPAYYEWTNLTAGNADCRADCAAVCGGLSEIVEGEQLRVTVDCIPGRASDCRSGVFSVYEGVNCVLQPSGIPPNQWTGANEYLVRTGGGVPQCIVPLTATNANIECRRFGGPAAGGSCGTIPEGDSPSAYYTSRPSLGGIPGVQDFSTVADSGWHEAVTRPEDSRTGTFEIIESDGICYRYGVRFGGAPTYDGFDPLAAEAQARRDGGIQEFLATTYVPSSEYVCILRKKNTCGTASQPPIPGNHSTAIKANYGCQDAAAAESRAREQGKDLSDICYTANTSEVRSLCVNSPSNYLCCQGGSVFSECYTDAQCDERKNESCRNGRCVVDLVCDPRPGTDAGGLSYTDRRCRPASGAEKANDNVCSYPLNFESGITRCPTAGQACCIPRDPAMVSGCAADKVINPLTRDAYVGFGCASPDDLPDEWFISKLDSDGKEQARGELRTISPGAESDYSGSGNAHCLRSNIPVVRDGVQSGSERRCDIPTQFCCNKLAPGFGAPEEDTRKGLGEVCAGGGYTCQAIGGVNGVAAESEEFGLTVADYLQELSRTVCRITPIEGDLLETNRECKQGGVCCAPNFSSGTCEEDADCGAGQRCDTAIHVCLNADVIAAATAGDGCYDDAVRGGFEDTDILTRTQKGPGEFSCQFVSPSQTAQNVGNNCLPPQAACGGIPVPGGLGQGYRAQCCIPGTGVSASQAAQAQRGRGASVGASFGLQLSPCIKDGNCGLEDVLFTGAQFANFLIEISGAVFLVIFVYGGFLYLTAGKSERAMKGKKMIIQASVAMVLILAAFTFVNFVQQSLIGAVIENEAQASCGATPETANFACQFLASDPADGSATNEEISRRGCVRNRCPGPENYLCCPL